MGLFYIPKGGARQISVFGAGVLNPASVGTLLAMIGLQEPKKGATVAMKMDEVTAAEGTVELMAKGEKRNPESIQERFKTLEFKKKVSTVQKQMD